jgi:hypothetical protein
MKSNLRKVKSKEAAAKGLNVLMFELLAKMRPETVSVLGLQYRVNADVMFVCNELV